MSAENVRVVRRLAEAFNDREVAAMLETLAPGAELHPLRAQLGARAYRGHQGWRETLADFDQDWECVQVEPEEFHDAGEQVDSLVRLRARGRTSHVDLCVPLGLVWMLRDGRIVRGRTLSGRADALRAAGLA